MASLGEIKASFVIDLYSDDVDLRPVVVASEINASSLELYDEGI